MISVAADAILLPGLFLGTGALIHGASVVTKRFDSGPLVLGVPANYIRRVQEI